MIFHELNKYNIYPTCTVLVIMDDENPGNRSFIVSLRGPGRKVLEIQDTHRSADPLHFTLLFSLGQDGWHLGLRASPLQYYSYQIQVRQNDMTIHWQVLLRYIMYT